MKKVNSPSLTTKNASKAKMAGDSFKIKCIKTLKCGNRKHRDTSAGVPINRLTQGLQVLFNKHEY